MTQDTGTRFQVGDRVRHKDGGPLGTVISINTLGNPMVNWDGDPDGFAMGYKAGFVFLAESRGQERIG